VADHEYGGRAGDLVREPEQRVRGRRRRCGALRAPTCAPFRQVLFAAVAVPVAPAAAEPEPISITDVSFVGGRGVILHGIVVAPRSSGKRRPALVMLEGAGNRGRQELQPAAEVLARRGVITLIYDKRTVGYSLLRRDYELLADDAVAAVVLLATRRDVAHRASDCGPNRKWPTSPRSPAVGRVRSSS
jgi:hypothetical protein